MAQRDNFPETGFVRLASILAPRGPIPVSRSTWWAGVKNGRFPKPVKLGPRTTAWRVEDIRRLIRQLSHTQLDAPVEHSGMDYRARQEVLARNSASGQKDTYDE